MNNNNPYEFEFFSDLFYLYKNYHINDNQMKIELEQLKKKFNYHDIENTENESKGFRGLFFRNELEAPFLKELFDWGILKKDNISLIRTPSYKGLGHEENIIKYQIEPSILIKRTLESCLKLFSSFNRKYFYNNDQIRINEKDGEISYLGLPGSILWENEFWKNTEKTYLDFNSIEEFSLKSDISLPLLKAFGIKYHGIGMPDDETGNSIKVFFENESSPLKLALEIKVDKLSVYVRSIDLYKIVDSAYLRNDETKNRTFPLSIKVPERLYFILGKKTFINDPFGFKNGMLLLSHKEGHQIQNLIYLIDNILEGYFSWDDEYIDLNKKMEIGHTMSQRERMIGLFQKEGLYFQKLDRRFFTFLNDQTSFQRKLN